MSIVERTKALGLPLDQIVVIGSGVMDALGLREARDIDLVVTMTLFDELKQTGEYKLTVKFDQEVLEKDDAEIWLSWGNEGVENFYQLYADGITMGDVRFANPEFVLWWKRDANRPKDQNDIELLSSYLNTKNSTEQA